MPIQEFGRALLGTASKLATHVTDNYLLERRLKAALSSPPLFHPRNRRIINAGCAVQLHLFFPETRGPHGVLLFFHGGGWATGDAESYTPMCRAMSHITNRTVVSVDYRLAPEHPFPAGLQDCYAVAEELYTHPSRWGVDKKDIVLIGDSAGANLCAAVSLMARDRGTFLPTAQILLYPAVYNDYSELSPFQSVRENGEGYILTAKRLQEYINYYIPTEQRQNPYFAPLLCNNLSNQPPTLLFSAEYDPLRDEGEAYASALRHAGNHVEAHRVPGALHGYFSLSPKVPIVRMTYGKINRFLRMDL